MCNNIINSADSCFEINHNLIPTNQKNIQKIGVKRKVNEIFNENDKIQVSNNKKRKTIKFNLPPKSVHKIQNSKEKSNFHIKESNLYLNTTSYYPSKIVISSTREYAKLLFKLNLFNASTQNVLLEEADHFFQKEKIKNIHPINFQFSSITKETDIIDQIFNHCQGFCIGEVHDDPGPKDFLIHYMSYLKQKGVKILFMEEFYNDVQKDLDDYFQGSPLSEKLKNYNNGVSQYAGYLEVLQAAKENQIRVISIDSSAAHFPNIDSDENQLLKRVKTMNYFAYKVIKKTSRNFSPEDKYVVFLGSGHVSRYNETTLGVAELMQIPSIAISDSIDLRNQYLFYYGSTDNFNCPYVKAYQERKINLIIERQPNSQD